MEKQIDVFIIGGGIVGCAAAMMLGRYDLDLLIAEQAADIAVGATKANSGILHAGYDCYPGTLKAELNVRGVEMYAGLVKTLDIPYRNNGSLVIGFSGADMDKLKSLYEQGISNGVTEMELLDGDQVRALEPGVNPAVTGALRAASAGVISPYEAAIAFGENAAENGAGFLLDTMVASIKTADAGDYRYRVCTNRGIFRAKAVVNAAGVYSAAIHNMVCQPDEKIQPQRGQYYLLDNTQKDLVKHTIFQLPSRLGKGVLVAPTVDYNILLGPTSEETNSPAATETTREGLSEALEKAALSLKSVPIRDRITAFAGIRAKHKSKDFVINESLPGFIDVLGIDSPGLSAAPAIAERVAGLVLAGLNPKAKPDYKASRTGIRRFRDLSPDEQIKLIRENAAYGQVVCRCETITEAEIIDAIRRPVGARNLDAVKRRTRAQMGRCQGGFCTVRLIEILSSELNIPETAVTKNGAGSELMVGG